MNYEAALERAKEKAAAINEVYVVLETTTTINNVIKPTVLYDYHALCIHSWEIVLKGDFPPSNTKIHTLVNPDGSIKRG